MSRLAATELPVELRVGGLTPLSTVDWPGQLAAVVFMQGCPWRCDYCHNNDLQPACAQGRVPWAQVEALLGQRRGLLDGVVFSGGEPTAQPELAAAVRRVRELGFACALHTAGVYPRRIAECLPELDWIALDIKALPEHYEAITGVPGSAERATESLRLVIASGKAFECRTTVDWALLPPRDLVRLGEWLAGLGVREFAVQIARPVGQHYRPHIGNLGSLSTTDALQHLSTLFPRFTVRQ